MEVNEFEILLIDAKLYIFILNMFESWCLSD